MKGRTSPGQRPVRALARAAYLLQLHWTIIHEHSPLLGKRLEEVNMNGSGARLVGVVHDGTLDSEPKPSHVIVLDDILCVLGDRAQIAHFREMVR